MYLYVYNILHIFAFYLTQRLWWLNVLKLLVSSLIFNFLKMLFFLKHLKSQRISRTISDFEVFKTNLILFTICILYAHLLQFLHCSFIFWSILLLVIVQGSNKYFNNNKNILVLAQIYWNHVLENRFYIFT